MSFKVKDHYYNKAKKDKFLARSVYKLEEIDKDVYGYVYPTKVDDLSISVIKNTKDNYYEWRSTNNMPKVQEWN